MAAAAKGQIEHNTKSMLEAIPFENLSDPGAYVCNWNGHLLRVPDDAVKEGRSPLMTIKANQQLIVTKISTDPYIALTKARLIAADNDLSVGF